MQNAPINMSFLHTLQYCYSLQNIAYCRWNANGYFNCRVQHLIIFISNFAEKLKNAKCANKYVRFTYFAVLLFNANWQQIADETHTDILIVKDNIKWMSPENCKTIVNHKVCDLLCNFYLYKSYT